MSEQSNTSPEPPVVLITGAAGGLGSGLAEQFLAAGWRVALGYHRQVPTISGACACPVPLDVTDQSSVSQAVNDVVDRWKRLNVLINNAGLTADAALWRLTEEDWDKVLAVNLTGAFRCAQAALRPMIRQREGHIINISSFSGRVGAVGQANYASAKAGLIGLTTSLAKEVGSRNVRVNSVLPGVLPTPMTAGLSQKQLNQFAQANLLGRLNSISEVARFVLLLASLQNVSGQLFHLDSRPVAWT
jgi:3-oxoacyl-[acyl-carrier protein] reductase